MTGMELMITLGIAAGAIVLVDALLNSSTPADDQYGYTTLDCRGRQHRACSMCDCECHDAMKRRLMDPDTEREGDAP